MKRIYSLLLGLLMLSVFSASAANFQNETLSYVIQYKWGLVQKNAATAKLVLRNTANTYNITMSAQTLPWANSIYPVKDTLISMISKTNFKPLKYIKATHENKKFRKDILTYRYVKNHAYGSCTRFKQNPGGPVIKSVRNCSATGPTYDMVSIFYYIRTLNFQTMLSSKKVVRANIFSGSNPEVITIKCVGVQKVKVPNGKVYQCYNLQFTFTMNGRKNSSAPINAWITTDAQHIPVKLVGTLPVGQVRCFLTGISK